MPPYARRPTAVPLQDRALGAIAAGRAMGRPAGGWVPGRAAAPGSVVRAWVSRHVLITRKSALGTGPVSASYLADYLGRHQRGISLEHIRRDRILAEALATGADPLHLALVFNIDHTNAMAYVGAARNLLSGPVPRDER